MNPGLTLLSLRTVSAMLWNWILQNIVQLYRRSSDLSNVYYEAPKAIYRVSHKMRKIFLLSPFCDRQTLWILEVIYATKRDVVIVALRTSLQRRGGGAVDGVPVWVLFEILAVTQQTQEFCYPMGSSQRIYGSRLVGLKGCCTGSARIRGSCLQVGRGI